MDGRHKICLERCLVKRDALNQLNRLNQTYIDLPFSVLLRRPAPPSHESSSPFLAICNIPCYLYFVLLQSDTCIRMSRLKGERLQQSNFPLLSVLNAKDRFLKHLLYTSPCACFFPFISFLCLKNAPIS